MADQMANLLLAGGDSSSGESDSEEAVGAASTQQPAAAAVTPGSVNGHKPAMTQSEMSAKLKNLYSPASKQQKPALVATSMPLPPARKQRPPPTQQTTPHQHRPMQASLPLPSRPPQQSHHSRSQPRPQQSMMPQRPTHPSQQQRMAMPPMSRAPPVSHQPMMPSRAPQPRTGSGPGQFMQPPPQQQPRSRSNASEASNSSNGVPSTASRQFNSNMSDTEMKKKKERFIIFARILLKYLEGHDQQVAARVKNVINDCVARNKRRERGYESVTSSMRDRLKKIVNETYWKRAEVYTERYYKQKLKQEHQKDNMKKIDQAKKQNQQLSQIQTKHQRMNPNTLPKSNPVFQQPRKPSAPTSKAQIPPKTAPPTQPTRKMEKPQTQKTVPEEYKTHMDKVDHISDLDWQTTALTMGPNYRVDVSEEQRRLMYTEQNLDTETAPNSFLKGWGTRNVLSVRGAWARVRLPEYNAAMNEENPRVGGVQALPAPPDRPPRNVVVPTLAKWHNEETAENDKVLALMSEGLQIYLKKVLEKAVFCARQRHNVDGVRLWLQQVVATEEQPLSLRLGCDTTRQIAQATGNAAMACKRMEEAIEQKSHHIPSFHEALESSVSMGQLSMVPKLSKAVTAAEIGGKRSFEVYGGKKAHDPPLGTLPKKAKLELSDIEQAQFLEPRRSDSAATLASSILF